MEKTHYLFHLKSWGSMQEVELNSFSLAFKLYYLSNDLI